MITVKKLKKLLSKFDDNAIIIISSDGEGNNFSPLETISIGYYISETAWNGDFVDLEEVAEEKDINLTDAVSAITFWPMN